MKKKTCILLLVCFAVGSVFSQMVIGSTDISSAAVLKIDIPDTAMKIPILSVAAKNNGQNPVSNPARGLLIYNTNKLISDNLIDGATYWGDNNQYYSFTTRQGIIDVINDSRIPLMVFSTTVGQKANVGCGAGTCSGWQWSPFDPTSSEILIDSFSAWNTGNNSYTIPLTDTYVIEYSTNISNSSNGDGTSAQNIYKNGISANVASGRFISVTNRAYTTVMMVQGFNAGDVLNFKYIYTQNNYRLQTGTINIYKY